MPPFLSYSGRGGSHRGRGRGRGGANRIPRKNQWVRSSRTSQETYDTEIHEEPGSTTNTKRNGGDVDIDTAVNSTISTGYSYSIMKKIKPHQLILSSKTSNQSTVLSGMSGDSLLEKEQLSQQHTKTLTRKGKNKLVALNSSFVGKDMNQTQNMPINSHSKDGRSNGCSRHKNTKNSRSDSVDKRKKAPATNSRPTTIKRVKLSATNSTDMVEADATTQTIKQPCLSSGPTEVVKNTDSKSESSEKFSDFSYREISRVKERPMVSTSNLHWSKKNNTRSRNDVSPDKTVLPSNDDSKKRPKFKNMGLVRIQPDEKNTPICPTFLRGLLCQDQFCRKRHDIPKKYAMPICSHFQRHGQCLRGDACIFRHVKVNAKALICTSFAILGFCEDEECTMQHIRKQEGRKDTGVSDTCVNVSNKSSAWSRSKPNNVYRRNKATGGG